MIVKTVVNERTVHDFLGGYFRDHHLILSCFNDDEEKKFDDLSLEWTARTAEYKELRSRYEAGAYSNENKMQMSDELKATKLLIVQLGHQMVKMLHSLYKKYRDLQVLESNHEDHLQVPEDQYETNAADSHARSNAYSDYLHDHDYGQLYGNYSDTEDDDEDDDDDDGDVRRNRLQRFN